eukprot:Gb_26175 [translate_table: standard]
MLELMDNLPGRLSSGDSPPNGCYIPMAVAVLPRLTLYPTFLSYNAKLERRIAKFCTAGIPPTPPDKGIVTEFLLKRCGLTQENITKAFRHCNRRLNAKSTQNLENVVELLKDCGLTPPQIRTVIVYNPDLLFLSTEKNLKPKVAYLKTFMDDKGIAKLIFTDSKVFNMSLERRLKTAISFLREFGMEGEALSHLLAKQPRLLTISEKKISDAFKQAEKFGLTKGSKLFSIALHVIIAIGKENLERKLLHLKSVGFSEEEALELCKRMPGVLGLSEEKVKRNVDFVVKSVGLPITVIVKYPILLTCSLETRISPRYRVVEALKSMKLWKTEKIFPQIVMLPEERFLERYINPYSESSLLRDIYKGASSSCLFASVPSSRFQSCTVYAVSGISPTTSNSILFSTDANLGVAAAVK